MKSAAPLLEMFPDDYGEAINAADQLLMHGDTYMIPGKEITNAK